MIRRDWLKVTLDIIAQAVAAALGLKRKGEAQAAAAVLEAAVRKVCGMDGRLALGLPFKEFLGLALRGEEPSAELRAALAGMFRRWGELLAERGQAAEAAAAAARAAELSQS